MTRTRTIRSTSTPASKVHSRWEISSGNSVSLPLADTFKTLSSSEIHGDEIRKLEIEYSQLAQIKLSLDNQLLTVNEKIKILSHKIQRILEMILPKRSLASEPNSEDTDPLLVTAVESLEQIESVLNQRLHLFDSEQELWKKRFDEQDHLILKYKQDITVLMKQWNDTQTVFTHTQDNLVWTPTASTALDILSCRSLDHPQRRTPNGQCLHVHIRGSTRPTDGHADEDPTPQQFP